MWRCAVHVMVFGEVHSLAGLWLIFKVSECHGRLEDRFLLGSEHPESPVSVEALVE